MYKTILVHVDETARCAPRTEIAARLAVEYDAHLVGAAVTGLSPYLFPNTGIDPGVPAIVFPIEELRAEAERLLDIFEPRARQAGANSIERLCIDDEAGVAMSMQARYADLVVISQTALDEFRPRLRSDFPEYLVLNCARPVLILPHSGVHGALGRRVTVAWNGSSNATHAIASAIPLLRRAQQVSLVVFNAGSDCDLPGELPGADMGNYLARHGIRVEVSAAEVSGDAGEALLSFAADKGSDLIVMGGYGRSRFREILLGGASRTALLASPIPLWMAH